MPRILDEDYRHQAGPTSGLVRPLMSTKLKVAILLLGAIVLCTEVEAGYSAASIAVTAIVRNFCTANTDAATRRLNAAPANAEGDVAVDCNTKEAYSVAMNEGIIEGASATQGTSTRAADTLAYDIYKDAAHTKAWGTVAGPDHLSGTYRALQARVPVYGALAGEQPASAPNTERVTMTVNY